MLGYSNLRPLILSVLSLIAFIGISTNNSTYAKEANRPKKVKPFPLPRIILNPVAKQGKTRGGCLVIPFAPYSESIASIENTSTIVKTGLPNPTIWVYVRPSEGSTNEQELKINRILSISYSDPNGESAPIDSRNVTFKFLSNEKVYESKIESFTLPVKNSKQSELEIDKPYEITISCGSLGNEKTVLIQRNANTQPVNKNLAVTERITKFANSNLWLETVDTLINNSKCKPSETIVDWLEELANNKLPIRDESEKIIKTFKKQFINNCQ